MDVSEDVSVDIGIFIEAPAKALLTAGDRAKLSFGGVDNADVELTTVDIAAGLEDAGAATVDGSVIAGANLG